MIAWRGPFDPEAFSIENINKQLEKKFRPKRKRAVPDPRGSKPTLSPEAKQLLEANSIQARFAAAEANPHQPEPKGSLGTERARAQIDFGTHVRRRREGSSSHHCVLLLH
jgi:hypothetical protein